MPGIWIIVNAALVAVALTVVALPTMLIHNLLVREQWQAAAPSAPARRPGQPAAALRSATDDRRADAA